MIPNRYIFKQLIIYLSFISLSTTVFSQVYLDQNGLKTSVTNTLYANATQARRYQIASVAYNSYHWQYGGIIIIELFDQYYGIGYEKYTVEIGFGQGSNSGTPAVKLLDSRGIYHYAKITLGNSTDLSSFYGNQINRSLPIFLDVKYYAGYKARLTYMQEKVNDLTNCNQIIINENPTPIDIPDFAVSTDIVGENNFSTSGNIQISGNGDHYILNGKVGIGTITPSRRLTISETVDAYMSFKPKTTNNEFVIGSDYKGFIIYDQSYNNGNGIYRFIIDNSGNVGIGCTPSTSTKLAVDGKINAKEVVVTATVPSSDYVFKKDYKLKSLNEVEEFVNTNKHLPEVPSAAEFKEQGCNVGQMQDVLLKKVEELTLYVIEQQKQIDALKTKNYELEAKIK